jgi:hypothetical protein
MHSFKNRMAVWTVLFALLFTPAAFAEEQSDFGNAFFEKVESLVINTGLPDLKKDVFEKYGLLIKPYYKQGFELNSNIYSAPESLPGDKTDTSFSFTPGFQAVWQHQYGVIGGAYEATFKYFSQFSEQNTQDQSFLIYSDLFPTEDTYLRVSEKLDQQGPAAGSSAFEPVDFKDNTLNVVAGVHVAGGDWTHEFGYENFDRRFQQNLTERFNYNENKYDYRLYHKLNDKYRAYVGARLGLVDFDKQNSRDNTYIELPVGIEGTLPYEVMLNAALGFHTRNWHDDDRNDWSNVVGNLSLQKNFNNNKTAVEGGYSRRPVESSFENTTIYVDNMYYVGLKQLLTERLRGRASTYYSRRGFNERSFQGTRFAIGPALFVATTGQVYRHDHIWGVNLGFDYRLRKWLIFHVDYNFVRRNSNISALDYNENRLNLATTVPL